jgi:phosphoglycerate dehydrogenase-like enzyme
LYGQTVGIVGLGHTGKEIATRAKAMSMTVLGYRRRCGDPPPGVDRVYSRDNGDSLVSLLSASDFVVLALPLTDATHGLIDGRALSAMKPGAHLVNVARGAIVDEAALLEVLHTGRLGGAGLDCFAVEPLRAPNVVITPHLTPRLRDLGRRATDIVCENIRRYRAGERPLQNEVTPDMVYSRPLPLPPIARRGARAVRALLRRPFGR